MKSAQKLIAKVTDFLRRESVEIQILLQRLHSEAEQILALYTVRAQSSLLCARVKHMSKSPREHFLLAQALTRSLDHSSAPVQKVFRQRQETTTFSGSKVRRVQIVLHQIHATPELRKCSPGVARGNRWSKHWRICAITVSWR